MVVAAFIPDNANAQLGETMAAAVKNFAGVNAFNCDTAAGGPQTTCFLHQRMVPERDAGDINGQGAGVVDGFPLFRSKTNRYDGDAQVTSNFALGTTKACEPWYSLWDGATNPGQPTYISYYGTQSAIINFSEAGGPANTIDCSGASVGLACFGALDAAMDPAPAGTGSGQGDLVPVGAMSVVPVPTVVTNGAATGTATLSLVPVHAGNNINIPSATSVPCTSDGTPSGTPFFFDDLTLTQAPSAVFGVGLYVYSIAAGAPFRGLDDLEGTTSVRDLIANPSSRMACTDSGVTGDCPSVHFIPCGNLSGGAVCLGDLLAPNGGSFDVSAATVDAALGTELGDNVAVFLTKIHYRGSVSGSAANPANTTTNPSLVSLFSAASTRVSYSALAARVSFTNITAQGNRVSIEFETVGAGFANFKIQRADDGVSFVDLGTVAGTGETSYSFIDSIRGRRPASPTYRIIAEDFDGNLTQIFQTVDLTEKPPQGGPRR
jgi:hypothetical protein